MELQPSADEEATLPQCSGDAAVLPAPPPRPQEEEQPDPSGSGEPERSGSSRARAGKKRASLRWLFQQSLGRLLGGALPAQPRDGREAAATEYQKLPPVKDTGFFITGADGKIWFTLTMAAVAGILHWYYIRTLFEHDRHFSHLSTLEREMSFRTEMGLYYSYFKTIIEAPSFWKGLCMIINDRLTEYPLVINTLKRFNLYPEVVLAFSYRIYTGTMNTLDIQTKACWTVNRGEGLSPVESCEGLGDPASFYVAVIFLLNGFVVFVLFLYSVYLSGSRLGGLLTVACYFFNHEESTRVMWTPPLRESFSYPFLVVQMYLLTYILRTQNVKRSLIALSVSNVFFMLPWQFAQFVLLTQVISVFGIYVVGFIDSQKLQEILYAHMASLAVCFVLMFGNSTLLTSYYAVSLVVCWFICGVSTQYLKMHGNDTSLWAIEGVSCLFGTVILKFFLCQIFGESDDAHINNLLKAKLTDYRDFHTTMNTCAVEFDFMGYETPVKYLKTFLLPLVFFIFIVIVAKAYQYDVHSKKSTERQEDTLNHGEMVYHALQLIFFMAFAILIMRLKLFLTPHMCIMASLICSKQLFGWIFSKVRPGTVVFTILAIMAVEGTANIQKEWGIIGEFCDLPQEELLLWIKTNTKPDAVFAGAMQTMPIVKMSALRPIVNHPHYENAGSRARTKIVYSMYSRKSAGEVKKELLTMGVNYYILEDYWCLRKTRPGCSFPEIWDMEDPANAGKIPLCNLMSKDSRPHFVTVFKNDVFQVLKVTRE